jgi:hypothetical protein
MFSREKFLEFSYTSGRSVNFFVIRRVRKSVRKTPTDPDPEKRVDGKSSQNPLIRPTIALIFSKYVRFLKRSVKLQRIQIRKNTETDKVLRIP